MNNSLEELKLNYLANTLDGYANDLIKIFYHFPFYELILKFYMEFSRQGIELNLQIIQDDMLAVETLSSYEQAQEYWEMIEQFEEKYKGHQAIISQHLSELFFSQKKGNTVELQLNIDKHEMFKKCFLGDKISAYLEKIKIEQSIGFNSNTNEIHNKIKL